MKLKLLFALLIVSISNAQTQIGQDIPGEGASDHSGHSVSISSNGNIIAIGALGNDGNGQDSGHVRVYNNVSGVWVQIGNDINGKAAGDLSGHSVSLSGDGSTVAIGSPGHKINGISYSGHARVFKNTSGNWIQVGNDIIDNVADSSGSCVAISSNGNIVAVASAHGNSIVPESVRIYQNILGTWTQIGSDIVGESPGDLSGQSIAISDDGSIVAIGAPTNSGNGNKSGHVRVYENLSGVWTQIGNDIDGRNAEDRSGTSVALSANGEIVAIGSPNSNENILGSGHVRVFKNISGTWTQLGNIIMGELGYWSGQSVSLSSDGTILSIGNNVDFTPVRIFKNVSGIWTKLGEIGKNIPGFFGYSQSLSSNGDIIVVGAYLNSLNNIQQSGAGYVYNLTNILSSDTFALENFNIYPNPTTDILNIELKENLTLEKVLIYNTTGQLVKETTEKTINLSSFAKGIYNVQVLTNQGKATKKVIVK